MSRLNGSAPGGSSSLDARRRRLLERLLAEQGVEPDWLPIPRTRSVGAVPLSHGQLALWLADQAQPGSAAYNMAGAFRLRGELSPAALCAARDAIVARHEVLRSRLALVGGRPLQEALEAGHQDLPEVDLRRVLEAAAREGEARRIAAAEARRAFDLGSGRLLRCLLVRLGERDHLLVLTVHHAAADRWSMGVLLAELGLLYAAALARRPSPLPPPDLQFRDYVAWERERLESGRLDHHLESWRQELAGGAPPLALPADRARRALPSGRGDRLRRTLPAPLAARVRDLAAAEGATAFSLLLAGFAALLGSVAGADRVVVGCPVALRERPETQGLVGFLVNTLPVVAELSPGTTFRGLLRETLRQTRRLLERGEMPLQRLIEELRPTREPGHNPIFQVMFAERQGAPPAPRLPGVVVEPVEVTTASAQVDLTLVVGEADGTWWCEWELDTDLFDRRRIAGLAEGFEVLLDAALTDPDRRLDDLSLLTPEAHAGLLAAAEHAWRLAPPPGGPAATVHGLVERAADRWPDAVAVELGEDRLTFRELDRRANRLSRRLESLGAGPDVLVGLFLERSLDLVVGLLGILKAGAAVVPLDPAHPPERLALLAADAGLSLVVTDQDRRPLLAALPTAVRAVEVGAAAGEPAADTAPAVELEPQALAYVIYTSGSTGRPNGVAVPHGAAATHFAAWARRVRLGPDDRVYQFASLSFDAALEQIFPTLLAGARLVLRGPEVPAPDRLLATVIDCRLTVLYLPTAYWQQLCEAWARVPASALGGLRLVNPGGDVMPPPAVRRYQETVAGKVPLLNGYGPTEAVVTAAAFDVPRGFCDDRRLRRVPIGAPLDGRVVVVLDRRGRPLPPGSTGELCVGGPLLARGYLGDPRRTAERFVPDAWSPRPGSRLYRTGDRAAWRPDGTLDFLGRNDHQVKVRGFRLELGEVEAALLTLPGIDQAVAAAPEQASGERRLVAYVVPTAEARGEARPETLRSALAERLPGHLLPTAWVVLDALPLNPNGKVDRRALPPPPLEPARPAGGGEPSGPRERVLARIWGDVLGRESIGARENFFSLGGDSILSLQIIARAHDHGLRLTPGQFFRYPTIAELAAVATTASLADSGPASGEVAPTPIQRWFFAQGFAEPHHWNQAQAHDSLRRIEPRWLHAAVAALHERHDALRSRFRRQGGQWRQVIEPPGGAPPVSVVDLGALSEDRRRRAVRRATERAHRSLDLEMGPVGRVVLFQGGAADRLLLLFHHLVVDGVSWRVLLDDLGRGLRQAACGRGIELPPRTTGCGRWGELLARLAEDGRFDDQLERWRAAVDPGEPPLGAGEAVDPVRCARRFVVELDAAQTTRVLAVGRSARVQVQDLLLASLLLAWARRFGRRSLVVELEAHGREDVAADVDLSRTVGWLTAKYPVRLELPEEDDSPIAAVRRVKEALREVPDRGLGYGVLRYLGAGERAAALSSLPSPALTFNYMGQLDASSDAAWPLAVRFGEQGPECSPRNRAPSPLEVVALVIDGRLRLQWSTRIDQAREPELRALADDQCRLIGQLAGLCADRGSALSTPSDFPLARLDQSALDHVLHKVPALEDAYPASPVQQGMLFHSLSEPRSGVYVEQLVLDLEGELDAERFGSAWRQVVARHPVLRTGFVWEGVPQPLQAVAAEAVPPFRSEDWRHLPSSERQVRLASYLAEDRERGFELDRPPLLRLLLVREGDSLHRLVWSNHHLLVDGWAEPLVLQEVFAIYAAAGRGASAELPPRRPFRDYLEWLERQDLTAARAFWRRDLGDCRRACVLPIDAAADPSSPGHGEEKLVPPAALSAALVQMARREGLTANTLVQGAWAVLLADYTGRDDVVFGLTLSGRPADLPGADGIVGMFINTLPLRVRLDPGRRVGEWLHEVQAHTGELLGHAHTPLVEAVRASGVPRGQPLFDTLVVCMNQPQDYAWFERPAGEDRPRIRNAHGVEQTNYPLTVTARPGAELLIELNHRLASVGRARARAVLADLEAVLGSLVGQPESRLVEVVDRLAAARSESRRDAAERRREERRRVFATLQPRPARRSAVADG